MEGAQASGSPGPPSQFNIQWFHLWRSWWDVAFVQVLVRFARVRLCLCRLRFALFRLFAAAAVLLHRVRGHKRVGLLLLFRGALVLVRSQWPRLLLARCARQPAHFTPARKSKHNQFFVWMGDLSRVHHVTIWWPTSRTTFFSCTSQHVLSSTSIFFKACE